MRVLFVSANSPSAYIDIEREHKTLQTLLEIGRHSLRVLPAAEVADLREALAANQEGGLFDVLHFSGHATKADGLLLRGKGRRTEALSGEALSELLEGSPVKLVVLNACDSESLVASISRVVPAVIGTTRVVRDAVARRFTSAFYGALNQNCSVKQAFEAALKTGRKGSVPYIHAGMNPDVTFGATDAAA